MSAAQQAQGLAGVQACRAAMAVSQLGIDAHLLDRPTTPVRSALLACTDHELAQLSIDLEHLCDARAFAPGTPGIMRMLDALQAVLGDEIGARLEAEAALAALVGSTVLDTAEGCA